MPKSGVVAPASVRSWRGGNVVRIVRRLSLAYQVFGDGPVDLVFAGSFVSDVELFWTLPEFQGLLGAAPPRSVACSVLRQGRDSGRRYPVRQVRTLDDLARPRSRPSWTPLGFGKAVIFGISA